MMGWAPIGPTAGTDQKISATLSKCRRPERHCAGGARCPSEPVKETTMQYMLMIYGNEAGMQSASKGGDVTRQRTIRA
jgi:hypothetical protein